MNNISSQLELQGDIPCVELKEDGVDFAVRTFTDRYSPGALVVYYLNLEDSDVVLSLTQFEHAELHLYLLTPGDESDLTSRRVKLNGQTLVMSGSKLPPLLPESHKGNVTVTAQSFGFIVVPHAEVSLCVKYFTGQNLYRYEMAESESDTY